MGNTGAASTIKQMRRRADGRDYVIVDRGQVDVVARRLFGFSVPYAGLAQLAGAQPGERVKLRGDVGRSLLMMSVLGQYHTAERYIERDAAGRVRLVNQTIEVDSGQRQQGIARQAFQTQVEAARRYGIRAIVTGAARFDEAGVIGYKVMPLLGFDASLSATQRASLPSDLHDAHTVQDLYATQAGRHWWEEHGGDTEMTYTV